MQIIMIWELHPLHAEISPLRLPLFEEKKIGLRACGLKQRKREDIRNDHDRTN
jgi:hypothetical protein